MGRQARKYIGFATRQQVIAASDGGYRCAKCYKKGGLELHHIDPHAAGGSDDPSNLIYLCSTCHKEWHYYAGGSLTFEKWLELPPVQLLYAWLGNTEDQGVLDELGAVRNLMGYASGYDIELAEDAYLDTAPSWYRDLRVVDVDGLRGLMLENVVDFVIHDDYSVDLTLQYTSAYRKHGVTKETLRNSVMWRAKELDMTLNNITVID